MCIMFYDKIDIIDLIKSNCVRPPHPKGWGMLRAARPVFWEFRTRRVFVAQIPLICTICFIDLEEQKEHARVHFIPDLKVGVFVTLRAPDVINASIKLSSRRAML